MHRHFLGTMLSYANDALEIGIRHATIRNDVAECLRILETTLWKPGSKCNT